MKNTPWLQVTLAAMLLAATHGVLAQVVYRSVGKDGRITYSDQPPVAASSAFGGLKEDASSGNENARAGLPYVLIQAMGQFPVTLYTGSSCGPCNSARALLVGRGVPFTENTVSTQQDIDVLKRVGGDTGLPFLTIGGQHLRGFSETEWNRYLDAAGYPSSSQLPSGYRFAPATALAPLPTAPVEPARSNEGTASNPPQPQTRTPTNPGGIQF